MKLIFLDIDGVLNSIGQCVAKNHSTGPDSLNPIAIGLLKYIVKTTGAEIVISSTWRTFGNKDWFKGLFESYGWRRPPIHGTTRRSKAKEIRGEQIKDYISNLNVIQYIILDDDSDFYDDQPLVHVSPVNGLLLKETIECIDILGCDEEFKQTVEGLKLHVNFKRKNDNHIKSKTT